MYLLAIGVLALVIGAISGMLLFRRFAWRLRRPRVSIANLPMFQARAARRRASRSRAHQRRARSAKERAAESTTIRLKPRITWRRILVFLLPVVLVASVGAGLFIYNRAGFETLVPGGAAVELAVQLPLSGDAAQTGIPPSEGIEMAIEEANASGQGPSFTLTTYDDQGSNELARGMADQIVLSQALVVLGPAFSTTALATGPVYAKADLVSLPTNATSDQITANATTFRVLFKNSDEGELLAHYLVRVLGQKRAAVFVVDSSYGKTLREGFERTAPGLGLQADYYVFSDVAETSPMVRQIAQDPHPPPVVLLTLDREGAQLLVALRKLGVAGPFLGGDSLGKASFPDLVKSQPEEQSRPGFFTDGLYALAPTILDSANADILAFAERYRARFGHAPNWSAVAGYDAATLAMAAVRATVTDPAVSRDLPTRREAVGSYLRSLDRPDRALPGLLGPFWFDQNRARQQAIRIGRFQGGRFESAPIQIVSASAPDSSEIDSGAVFELGPDRYARLQLVAHTGVFVNAITQVDPSRSSFTADFYLWLRFAHSDSPGSPDPTNLRFPDLASGSFNPSQPMQQLVLDDGTEYRLWRMQAEFRNRFDQRRFPFDQQTLVLSFFNPDATADQLVYAVDDQGGAGVVPNQLVAPGETPAITAPDAFRTLSDWVSFSAQARRQNLITDSALGNPTRSNQNAHMDFSGFMVTVTLERRAFSAFANTMLPLIVLSLILFGSLFLPSALRRERLIVATVATLCGIVPLIALNSQFGAVGYTMTVGNIFYVYFGLALLCMLDALIVRRVYDDGHLLLAARVEIGTRIIFVITVIVTVVLTALFLWR